MQLERRLHTRSSQIRGHYWNWPAGSSDDESRPTEDPYRAPIPFRQRAPPRRKPHLSHPPIWIELTQEHKTQLLRVLKRMLTDRLAAEPKDKGGGHELH
jgi:hypothetical protein